MSDLIPNLKKTANTKGGEYKGPCPWCGGTDRFTYNPAMYDGHGFYICRSCGESGNTMTYLMQFEELNYHEACAKANIKPDVNYKCQTVEALYQTFSPGEPPPNPSSQWQQRAEQFLFSAYKQLCSAKCRHQRAFLARRGIGQAAIMKYRIGYNPASMSFDPSSWGIYTAPDESSKPIWLPEGIVIPYYHDSQLIRLRIRQSDPAAKNRYVVVRGSSSRIYAIINDPSLPAIIVESELDAIMLDAVANNPPKINPIAIGSAQAKPDLELHQSTLEPAPKIFVCLDADDAGKVASKFWINQYKNAALLRLPDNSKDPGEYFTNNASPDDAVDSWIAAACRQYGVTDKKDSMTVDDLIKIDSRAPLDVPGSVDDVPNDQPEDQSSDQPDTTTFSYTKYQKPEDQTCLHGERCIHFERSPDPDVPELIPNRKMCMLVDCSVFQLERCPQGKWEPGFAEHMGF